MGLFSYILINFGNKFCFSYKQVFLFLRFKNQHCKNKLKFKKNVNKRYLKITPLEKKSINKETSKKNSFIEYSVLWFDCELRFRCYNLFNKLRRFSVTENKLYLINVWYSISLSFKITDI